MNEISGNQSQSEVNELSFGFPIYSNEDTNSFDIKAIEIKPYISELGKY